jgi:hypothetical protein
MSLSVHLHKEREFISPESYKIQRCIFLEVFIPNYKYFAPDFVKNWPFVTGLLH